ncbi:18176_t:CDS:1, partial [Funneliformis geosporum]
ANYDVDFSTNINVGGFFVFKCASHGNLFIFDPYDILKEIKSYPDKYSEYLKALTKPYELIFEDEGDYRYFKLKYNATGKMQGIYGYQVDSKKQSTPLNNTATPTQTQIIVPTNQANCLAANKYSSASLALLTGLFLLKS